ncbi:MAG: glycerophosphodiester phosphodiesterase [Acidimicrobiia bacterium]|nr:glycerophosphodiester phosphodiesterase [Acidimicrobiia bacterium]
MIRPSRLHRVAAAAVSAAAIAVTVGAVAVLSVAALAPARVERATSGVEPGLFFDRDGIDPATVPDQLLLVAHNAGSSRRATTAALALGARAIEIDVISIDGTLYAAHDRPPDFVGSVFLRRPTLDAAWEFSASASSVFLDLKTNNLGVVDDLLAFLDEHDSAGRAIVVSPSVAVLGRVADRGTTVGRVLSIGSRSGLDRALDADLVGVVTGVSVRESLLDRDVVAAFERDDLDVIAWTVNGAARLAELHELGVDGAATDNLAFIEQQHETPDLVALPPVEEGP